MQTVIARSCDWDVYVHLRPVGAVFTSYPLTTDNPYSICQCSYSGKENKTAYTVVPASTMESYQT